MGQLDGSDEPSSTYLSICAACPKRINKIYESLVGQADDCNDDSAA